MRFFGLFILLSISIQAQAQFGFSARTNLNNFNSWNDYYDRSDINQQAFRNTTELGINYWFRLENIRIEFLPEVTFTLPTEETLSPSIGDNFTSEFSQLSFYLNTNLYFLDFENDCDCPTFSKQGTFVPKALHLIINPGISLYQNDINILSNDPSGFGVTGLAYNIGAGLGLDIGINNLLTITPFFMINYSSSFSSEAIDQYSAITLCEDPQLCDLIPEDAASNFHPQFGIRINLRPDYVKANRY